MKKSILSLLFLICSVGIFAQQPTPNATVTTGQGTHYTLSGQFDYHVNVDTLGGTVDTTKIYLPVAKYYGEAFEVSNSTQDTTKPVVIYAHSTDAIDHTASGTVTLTYKPAIKATNVKVRWVGGLSGWKILYKY